MIDEYIIDGVDVSECEFYNKDDKTCREVNGKYDTDICEFDKCENSNCNYKQLKRKEQECERLKIEVERWESAFTLDTKMLDNAEVRANKLEQQINKLKAENEQAEQKLEKIQEYCNKYPQNSIGFKKNILQIISEVEDDR